MHVFLLDSPIFKIFPQINFKSAICRFLTHFETLYVYVLAALAGFKPKLSKAIYLALQPRPNNVHHFGFKAF